MYRTSIMLSLALFVVVGGSFATAPRVEAACSANGYYHSQGKCEKSWKNEDHKENKWDRDVSNNAYLQQYIRQLEQLLAQLRALQGGVITHDGSDDNADVDVMTKAATSVDEDSATLRGVVDFNNQDEATVYFRWGTKVGSLNKETTHVVRDADEDDVFESMITNLEDNTTYYFRAVAEDENGDRTLGTVMRFETNDNGDNNDDNNSGDTRPAVDTDDVSNITDMSAKIRGSVDMNDFNNGHVFFIYGEDESMVGDVEDDFDTYEDVDEDGDNLQKVSADSDLDASSDYVATITGLNDDTDIFYAMCVAFENEDGDDEVICGNVEDFTTDNN